MVWQGRSRSDIMIADHGPGLLEARPSNPREDHEVTRSGNLQD